VASNKPLVRTRYIDGLTTTPAADATGSQAAPFASPEAWLSNTTLFPPTLEPDNFPDTCETGVTSATPASAWVPLVQTWAIPPGRRVCLTCACGVPSCCAFGEVLINWANVELANQATTAYLGLQNLDIADFAIVLTDQAGSSPSVIDFSSTCECGDFSGTLNCAGAQNFESLFVTNCAQFTLTAFTGPATATVTAFVTRSSWQSTDFSCLALQVADGYAFVETGTLSVGAGGAAFLEALIQVPTLTIAAGGFAYFQACSFINPNTFESAATALTAPFAFFDGPSWNSFVGGGGTLVGATIGIVNGGFLQGPLPGANLTGTGTINVSIDGVGATAGFTKGGNWYTATALTGVMTVDLVDSATSTNTQPGDTIRITRTDASGNTLTVKDATSGATLGTVAAGGNLTARYSGTAWALI
jgi:hypothetical protein